MMPRYFFHEYARGQRMEDLQGTLLTSGAVCNAGRFCANVSSRKRLTICSSAAGSANEAMAQFTAIFSAKRLFSSG
jgi:hypothetical protein